MASSRRTIEAGVALNSHDGEDEEFSSEQPKVAVKAWQKPHHLTDVPWAVLYLLGYAGYCYICLYAWEGGDFKAYTGRLATTGEICGSTVSNATDRPYLFLCINSEQSAKHSICVGTCPKSSKELQECPNPSYNKDADNATNSSEFVSLSSYQSYPYRKLCIPKHKKYQDIFLRSQEDRAAQEAYFQLHYVQPLLHSAPLLLVCFASTFVGGLLYCKFMDLCAGPIVKVSVQFTVIVPFLSGIYVTYKSFHGGTGLFEGMFGAIKETGLGVALIALGLVVGCVYRRAESSLETAVRCVSAACDCIFDERQLLLQPFILTVIQVFTFSHGLLFLCLLWLTGTPKVGPDNRRYFDHEPYQQVYLGFFVFQVLWTVEFVTSLSQYIIAWVSKSWYFTPFSEENGYKEDLPRCTLFRAMCNALRYHFGTLALGSLILMFVRIFRVLLGLLKDAVTVTNPVCACVSCLCGWSVALFENYFVFLNKNAYMDVAIHSTTYCQGARNAHEMVIGRFKEVFLLNAVQHVFQVAGIGVITILGTATAWPTVKYLPPFNDPGSSWYVLHTDITLIFAVIISAVMGVMITNVFDTVTDTMFYCFCTEVDHRIATSKEPEPHGWCLFGDEEGGGIFGWALGLGAEEEEEDEIPPEEKEVYAPSALRELIEKEAKWQHWG